MLKTIIFALSVLTFSSYSLNQCITNRGDNCKSKICFSHYLALSEGHVERFDCSEEPSKLNKSSCLEFLNRTRQASICLGNDTETHCCCHSSASPKICASDKRKLDELTQLWTTKQVWYLIFGHIGLIAIVVLLFLFYMKTVQMWPMDNVVIPEESKMTTILLSKCIFLLLAIFVIYFPIRKVCMIHPKGTFTNPRLFLYQIFEAGFGPSVYFSFPLVFFVFDFSFFVYIKTVKFINQSGGIALSVFKLVTVPAFVYEVVLSTFDLWDKDSEPGYCRLNGAIWQFMLSHFFLMVYHILLIFQTVLLTRLKRNLDYFQGDSAEPPTHVGTVVTTPTAETRIESEFSDAIYVYPRPFHVPRLGLSVLTVKNNRDNEWLALRALLSTTGFYKLYPSRFLIPPGKEISIEVEQCTRADNPTSHHNILIEWFTLGPNPPSVDSQRLWNKPYVVPQCQWQYFVIPVYVDESVNSSEISSSK